MDDIYGMLIDNLINFEKVLNSEKFMNLKKKKSWIYKFKKTNYSINERYLSLSN